MSNLSQFLSGSGATVGETVQMPALANAGTNQYTTSANELYVNTATASVVPQSSCNALLPAVLGATNDVILPTTQVNLSAFQQAANVPASGFVAGLITSASTQSTKGFYVGGVYYLFSPSDTANTIGWISTTDMVNYTPFVPVTPLAGFMIVDVFYNAANATWYFLEVNGMIFSTTNLSTFANPIFYSLPALGVVNGYVRLTCINGTWYAIGGSTTGYGYRISTSANPTAWTVAIENTSANAPAFNIAQGAGSGSNTEILVICNNGTLLQSTNNGVSFTASTIAISGATVNGLNSVYYSTRTGLYYLAVTASSYTYVMVSTTGTLATASWTAYSTGYLAVGNSASANINFIDTGTYVGPVFTTTSYNTYFFYGAAYNTLSSPLITAAQQQALENSSVAYYQGAKAMWLNNQLFVVYSSPPDPNFGYQRVNPMIVVASGATASNAIAVSVSFPVSCIGTIGQWGSWSGITWFNGAYYAASGAMAAQGTNYFYYYRMYLFRIAANQATFSCPVTPAVAYFGIALESATQIILSCPMQTPNGASLYWSASQSSNGSYQQAVSTIQIFSFNGATLSSCSLSPSGAALIGSNTTESVNGYTIPGQPNGSVSVPKWSSLLNAYVLALPAFAYSSGTGSTAAVAVGTVSSFAASSSLTNLYSLQAGGSGGTASVFGLDVLSSGGVVMVIQSGAGMTLSVDFGSGLINLFSSGYSNYGSYTPGNYAMWEIVSGGVSYLAYAYGTSNTYLNVYRLSATDGPVLVVNAYPVTNLNLTATVTNNLRRVFACNGSFYLGDTAAASQTVRNSLMLTPNALGGFTVAPEYLQVAGDAAPAGKPNTYTSQNTITSVNTVPVPAVFIPAGTAGSFLRVK